MKTLLLLSVALLASSCGVTEQLNKNCGSDIRMGCNFVFGMKDAEQDEQIAAAVSKNAEQDLAIQELHSRNNSLIGSIDALSSRIEELGDTDINNKAYLINLISNLEATVAANLITLQNLQTNVTGSVTKTIDVCGDYPGYFDEIILKTNTGKYIAYFEDGGRRFLSELPVGTYETTDKQKCSFTVSAAGLTHTVGTTVKTE